MRWLVCVIVLCLWQTVLGIGRWDVFSTKTLYSWAHDAGIVTANENNHLGFNQTLCKAIHVNMVVRHGARFPTLKNMKKIKSLHEKIVQTKDSLKFPAINAWKFRYDYDMEGELVTKGIEEQFKIGARTGTRFQQLFASNGKHVKFVSSRKSRAKDSSKNFHRGFSEIVKTIPDFENEINNATMRFYDGCYNYETQVEDNITQFQEFHSFSKTPEFIKIQKSLQSKLGITWIPTEDDVYQIYELCAYEAYIYNDPTWCDLLTDSERQVLEYGQDLEKFYESSYGHPINSQMTCPLVKDMFETMDGAINATWDYENPDDLKNTSYLAGKFQFGHSETVVPLMTALGLFKDEKPLKASDFATMTGRKFKSSDISPFSANLAFVVYVCDDMNRLAMNEIVPAEREFVVKLFVNEKEVSIPGCESAICKYSTLRKHYADMIENCNITEVCGSKSKDKENSDGNASSSLHFNLSIQLLTLAIVIYQFL